MRRRIVWSVASLIAVLATPRCPESTTTPNTTPPEFEDDAEAMRWYRLAAVQGHADAQVSLGAGYANGWGVLQDEAEAVRWYRLAAVPCHADAQLLLGFRYDTGEGAFSRTRPKRCAGSGWPPSRASGKCTPPARAFSRTTCLRTCG